MRESGTSRIRDVSRDEPGLPDGRDVACRFVTTACYSAFWIVVIGMLPS